MSFDLGCPDDRTTFRACPLGCGANIHLHQEECSNCTAGRQHILVRYDVPEVKDRCPLRPAKPGDAGLDLCNAGPALTLFPGQAVNVPSGVSIKVPDGWVGFVKARSSLFLNRGLFVVENVIDSGYTGPMFMITWNPGVFQPGQDSMPASIKIDAWERIAQLVVVPHKSSQPVHVQCMPKTARGDTGFGSTGRR